MPGLRQLWEWGLGGGGKRYLRIEDMIIVKCAKILREHVEGSSRGTHGAAIGAVAMGRAQDVRPGFVDFGVNCVCSCAGVTFVSAN